jgi:succinate dehydrogenase / fumarate reductase cytochrome b subunit
VCAFITWIALSALLYHLIAGIRHLLMDIGIGESLKGGRLTAYLVFITTTLGIILLGVWLYG